MNHCHILVSTALAACMVAAPAYAADTQISTGKSNEQISKDLANPVANLISVPFQFNADFGGGPNDDGRNYYLKFQPVIPFDFNDNWKIISRSILPFESENNFGSNSKTGLGDLTQTFFFTPQGLSKGFLWGLGPAFLIPTATDDVFGQGKWGIGPSAVVVKESQHWTLGILTNHIWSFAGESGRDYVSQTFFQPFVTYHLPDAWSLTFTSEYVYDWHDNEETMPLNLNIAKVVRIGEMPVSITLGGRYYADKPSGGPDWGLRAMITLVF